MCNRIFLLACVVVSLLLTSCYYPYGYGHHGGYPGYYGHYGHYGHHGHH